MTGGPAFPFWPRRIRFPPSKDSRPPCGRSVVSTFLRQFLPGFVGGTSGQLRPLRRRLRGAPFDGLGAKLPVRVPSHRQTGKTLPKPAGDRTIFSLSRSGESLPRLRKGRPDFWPVSIVTNRTDAAPCEGSLRTNMDNTLNSGFSGSLGICAKIPRLAASHVSHAQGQ
jgi:hypothetical protein